jgi:hypothetical protein
VLLYHYNVTKFEQIAIVLCDMLFSIKYWRIAATEALKHWYVARYNWTTIFCDMRFITLNSTSNWQLATQWSIRVIVRYTVMLFFNIITRVEHFIISFILNIAYNNSHVSNSWYAQYFIVYWLKLKALAAIKLYNMF